MRPAYWSSRCPARASLEALPGSFMPTATHGATGMEAVARDVPWRQADGATGLAVAVMAWMTWPPAATPICCGCGRTLVYYGREHRAPRGARSLQCTRKVLSPC